MLWFRVQGLGPGLGVEDRLIASEANQRYGRAGGTLQLHKFDMMMRFETGVFLRGKLKLI